MWFEVNVRLSEVTDLKWPHGTEWQCGNSTLAMSWPNHVQVLSFASMASRQGAVKHGFVSKIAGGCSSYDVIAPWPDLTWSVFFYQKLHKVCPIRYLPQNPAALFAAVFSLSAKNLGGGGCTITPVRARVNNRYCVRPNDIPRTAGGDYPRPLRFFRFFADSEKTAARSVAKFAIAVQPTIWHISKKNDDPMTPKDTPPKNWKLIGFSPIGENGGAPPFGEHRPPKYNIGESGVKWDTFFLGFVEEKPWTLNYFLMLTVNLWSFANKFAAKSKTGNFHKAP